VMRYVLGVWLGWQPQRYQFSWHILTGPTQAPTLLRSSSPCQQIPTLLKRPKVA